MFNAKDAISDIVTFLANGCYNGENSLDVQTLMDAEEALGKQMARKPLEKRNTNGTMLYRCPTCKEPLRTRTPHGQKLTRKGRYCDACGQAIDWEGAER